MENKQNQKQTWQKKYGFSWKTAVITIMTIVAVVLIGLLVKHYRGG